MWLIEIVWNIITGFAILAAVAIGVLSSTHADVTIPQLVGIVAGIVIVVPTLYLIMAIFLGIG